MPTWKLEIEYEGTRYRGWRMSPSQKTIQGELYFAARQRFSSKIEIIGAEDTEPGIHASSNVAHLKVAELQTDLVPRQIQEGLNEILPHDINILKVQNASDDFHAGRDAVSRQYLYQISTRRTAFAKNFVWWNKENPNVSEMKKAAELLRGKHDFQSFYTPGEDDKKFPTNIFIEEAEIFTDDYLICFRVRAKHFLPKMVQRLAGCLAEVGRGNYSVKDFERFVNFKSNAPSKFTAPPSGLFLEKVLYKID